METGTRLPVWRIGYRLGADLCADLLDDAAAFRPRFFVVADILSIASCLSRSMYRSSSCLSTLHTPRLPILRARSSPSRMSVYTWLSVMFKYSATSWGVMRRGVDEPPEVFPAPPWASGFLGLSLRDMAAARVGGVRPSWVRCTVPPRHLSVLCGEPGS